MAECEVALERLNTDYRKKQGEFEDLREEQKEEFERVNKERIIVCSKVQQAEKGNREEEQIINVLYLIMK